MCNSGGITTLLNPWGWKVIFRPRSQRPHRLCALLASDREPFSIWVTSIVRVTGKWQTWPDEALFSVAVSKKGLMQSVAGM